MGARADESLILAVLGRLWRAGEDERSTGGVLPMQELLRETGADVARVQQALAALEERGCVLERTPAGLRLATTGLSCWRDVLEEAAARKRMRLGRRVMVYASTTSTNEVAWQCIGTPSPVDAGGADGLVVLADEQTAGRGRLGHRWEARRGQSVLLSVLLTGMSADAVERLTLLAGLATAVALEKVLAREIGRGGHELVEIKWPNDLLLRGKKVAGILVERRALPGDPVVVGIGINVLQEAEDFSAEIAHRATSLFRAGAHVDRLRVAATVLEALEYYRSQMMQDAAWLEQWKSRCGMVGRPVAVRTGGRGEGAGRVVRGQVLDVAPLQGLVVRDEAGATHFLSAQTSSVV